MYRSAFVTGGAGFIGSRFIDRLRSSCENITVFDNLHPQVHGEDATVPSIPGAHFVRGDVRDVDALRRSLIAASPDLVVHLAAETGTGQSQDVVARYCEVNVTGTANVVEAVRTLPPAARRRFVLASSRAIYGEGAYLDDSGNLVAPPPRAPQAMSAGQFAITGRSGTPLTPIPTPESLPPSPASIYASTKLMQEYILLQTLACENIDVVFLRFQNVYGPGQSLQNPYTGVLSIFASQLQSEKILDIFEDGEIVRDFVYIDDVADAIMAAAFVERAPQAPINIGSGKPSTILQVARIMLKLFDLPCDRLMITGKFRSGDIRHAVADISRANSELGWHPRVSLETGLTRLVEWVRSGQLT